MVPVFSLRFFPTHSLTPLPVLSCLPFAVHLWLVAGAGSVSAARVVVSAAAAQRRSCIVANFARAWRPRGLGQLSTWFRGARLAPARFWAAEYVVARRGALLGVSACLFGLRACVRGVRRCSLCS